MLFEERKETNARIPALTMQKWAGIACFLLVVTNIVAQLIYLMGDLRDFIGQAGYALADFLYGPVQAACLVTVIFVLREHIGERAPRRMTMSLLAALLSALMWVTIAFIRSANRQYHLHHPELELNLSTPVLVVWTTLVAGLIATALHFMGWSLVMLGSAGLTTRSLPTGLCALYLAGGIASLFVYQFPVLESFVGFLAVVWAIWQGILFWKGQLR